MRKLLMLLALSAGLLSNLQASEVRPEMGRYTAAYSGGEGYKVWVARYGTKDKQEVLLQILGIDHELDGRVIHASGIASNDGSVTYTATVDGKSYRLLTVENTKAVLRLTGSPWGADLKYDAALVDSRPPQHLLSAYLDAKQTTR